MTQIEWDIALTLSGEAITIKQRIAVFPELLGDAVIGVFIRDIEG